MDDFPALGKLFARGPPTASPPRPNAVDDGELGQGESHVEESLVMRVERVSAVAQLWSMTPWSQVRRYKRVHVKGITLRLRQFHGILNFSFLALGRDKRYEAPRRNEPAGAGGDDDRRGGEMGNLDLERSRETESAESVDGLSGRGRPTIRRYSSTGRSSPVQGSGLGQGLSQSERRASIESGLTPLSPLQWRHSGPCTPGGSRLRALSTGRPASGGFACWERDTSASSEREGNGSASPLRAGETSSRDSTGSRDSEKSHESIGNLGVFKIVGEAFMRRFNAYADQVSLSSPAGWWATARRMSTFCRLACRTSSRIVSRRRKERMTTTQSIMCGDVEVSI